MLDEEELRANVDEAREAYSEEASRTRAGFHNSSDPAAQAFFRLYGQTTSQLSDQDVASLRKKFKFLADFSDQFIKSTPYDALLKTETTAI